MSTIGSIMYVLTTTVSGNIRPVITALSRTLYVATLKGYYICLLEWCAS